MERVCILKLVEQMTHLRRMLSGWGYIVELFVWPIYYHACGISGTIMIIMIRIIFVIITYYYIIMIIISPNNPNYTSIKMSDGLVLYIFVLMEQTGME